MAHTLISSNLRHQKRSKVDGEGGRALAARQRSDGGGVPLMACVLSIARDDCSGPAAWPPVARSRIALEDSGRDRQARLGAGRAVHPFAGRGHVSAGSQNGRRRGWAACAHSLPPLSSQACAEGPADQRPRSKVEGRRPRRPAGRMPALVLLGAALVLQAPAAAAYLIKSHLYWERVGAFPHYLTEPPGQQGGAWPRSSLCYNGPTCAKNTPDYRCNPDCGNPDISLKNNIAYPKAYLIRFVSSALPLPFVYLAQPPQCSPFLLSFLLVFHFGPGD